jgi:hypothetical protein
MKGDLKRRKHGFQPEHHSHYKVQKSTLDCKPSVCKYIRLSKTKLDLVRYAPDYGNCLDNKESAYRFLRPCLDKEDNSVTADTTIEERTYRLVHVKKMQKCGTPYFVSIRISTLIVMAVCTGTWLLKKNGG